jgi:signal transduction histidine kinase
MRLGLTWRTAIASSLVAVVVAGGFAVLVVAISRERRSERVTTRALDELNAGSDIERTVLDLETGVRGFIITRDATFLEPWQRAKAIFSNQARRWVAMIDDARQQAPARRIVAHVEAYITQYSDPLVAAARRGDPAASSVATAHEGKARVDAVRAEFDAFRSSESAIVSREQARNATAATRAITAAAVGIIGSVVLITGFATYLARAIVRPVRRAASLAERLAEGDLTARMPETGVGEIGLLEHSFNTMAQALEKHRDDLRELVDEQTALRRVATLVAHGGAPAEVFSAVATEINLLLSSDSTRLLRYETDGTAAHIAAADAPGVDMPVLDRVPIQGDTVAGQVFQTGTTVTLDTTIATTDTAARMRAAGVHSVTGAPIFVDNRLWGVVVVLFEQPGVPAAEIEQRVAGFTELVATGVANAQSRSDLEASRARVIAAADETRRRIERDLHDGTQQRLVTLGLEVRAAQEMLPDISPEVEARFARLSEGITAAVAELQELSRGLHPAILSRGGLEPALKSLARRSLVPVELDVRVGAALPQAVGAAVYYIVSEALTNATKHAQASRVQVQVRAEDSVVEASIRDDGIGGADPTRGSGLIGLRDRAEALGGRIDIASPERGGTSVRVTLPIPAGDGGDGGNGPDA